jgi:hypothetical protein
MRSPITRAAMSDEPPGGKGTTIVIGLLGNACDDWAAAPPAAATSAATINPRTSPRPIVWNLISVS